MEHGNLRHVVGNVLELRRNGRRSPAEIVARQQERLEVLVQFARERSPLYHERYNQLPAGVAALSQLPIVTKQELMERFDEWVTDPEVKRAGVEEFLADPTRVGQPYLGRYRVWTTSGITGRRGVFVHDDGALAVYTALLMARTTRHMRSLLRGGRLAALVTPGHFALTSFLEGLRRRYPIVANAMRPFSALEPLADLVRELGAFRPDSLIGCPTVLQLLAQERQAGRLLIDPRLVTTEGEWLAPATRSSIEAAFHCTVRDTYGASEFLVIASDCGHGWCHVNSEWVVLEPVARAFLLNQGSLDAVLLKDSSSPLTLALIAYNNTEEYQSDLFVCSHYCYERCMQLQKLKRVCNTYNTCNRCYGDAMNVFVVLSKESCHDSNFERPIWRESQLRLEGSIVSPVGDGTFHTLIAALPKEEKSHEIPYRLPHLQHQNTQRYHPHHQRC